MPARTPGHSYYHILQVSPQASQEVIRGAYRALLKDGGRHPDLGGDARVARELNEAYQVLGDPAARREYDAMLQRAAGTAAAPPAAAPTPPCAAGSPPAAERSLLACPRCRASNPIQELGRLWEQRCARCRARLLPPRPSQVDEAQNAYRLGLFLFEKGLFGRSLREFEQALKLRPQAHALHYWKGRCLYAQRRFGQAQSSFQAALVHAPQRFQHQFWLGQAHFANGQRHEALQAFQAALQLRPGHAAALLRLANCHYELGQHSPAFALLRQGLARHPGQLQMYILLGFILIRSGRPSEALDVFLRLQRLWPQNALAKKYIALLSATGAPAVPE